MKKYGFYLFAFISVLTFASCTGSYVVTERPAEVVYARPAAPSPNHIWISGDWYWTGGRYQWREGHWDRPRAGYAWRDGRWQNGRGGYKWVPGGWRRY